MNDEKTRYLTIQGRQNNSDFLENWFHTEIKSPLFNLQKFQNSEKNTPESCIMSCNLMKDEEILSMKVLKWKYRMKESIIQTFCKIGSPKKLGLLSLICRNSESMGKVLLIHVECIEI